MMNRLALISLLCLAPHIAAGSNFVTVKLPRGIELQVPDNWRLLSASEHKMINTSNEALGEDMGLNDPASKNVNLFAANSVPVTTYASVRVDSDTNVVGSPSDITDLTADELQSFQDEMLKGVRQVLQKQGYQLVRFTGVRRSVISGYPALTTAYRRSSSQGPVLVNVVQIFTPAQDIHINLAYRVSEEAIWKPVMSKVARSIVIHRWP